jgi:autotransporter-associated beta strand protein
MRRNLVWLFFWCGVLVFSGAVRSSAQLPAFPGAQGFGKFATGGRGGTVYHITTTNDSGAGSFRDAVSVSGRTIVFDVGGVIDYQPPRYAPKPNITIAGQTAPGGGITIYGNGLSFSGSHNNVARFIRVREGVNGDSGTDAMGIANGHDMIFDHITSSWGRDETFSINGDVTNISIQSAIISQGLQGHSAGGLIQTDGGVSILRSLYIDNDTRNPKVKGVNEFVNNIVCNWETIGYNMGGDSAGESFVNVFGNYFIRGQASSSSAISGGNTDFHIYATNNWYDGDRDGILDGANLPYASYGSMDLQTTPYAYPITSAYTPLTALKLAISDAGPSFTRDSVDELMITQLTSWGLLGGTITSELVAPMKGPGVVRNGTPYTDTDQDGMPDYWENGTGSNPNVANNNDPSPSGSGYTRLEDYLNWLAEPHGIALNTNVVIDLRQFTRGWVVVNHSPTWSVGNPTNGSVTLINSYFAKFTPTAGLNGTASFQLTVNDSDGEAFTRTMKLFFTPSAQSHAPIWHGDDISNNWDVYGDFNWHDGISLLYQFHNGESVTFDDSGTGILPVSLIGSLQPALVTVNATKNYTFSGAGSLDGAMTLNKTNSGTLIVANTNNFTGATIVSNGTLLVHGALRQSSVTVKAGGTIGGNGSLGNSLTALTGSTITPGNGIGSPGTLTITNTLTLSGGVTNRFDLSDDPAGTIKTNDVIRVIGNLNLSGVNVLKFSLLDGLPGNGVYTLFTYSGTLSGSLANFSLSGISGTLTNPPGAIAIIVNATRPPAALVWTGNGGNSFWDNGTNVCWLNDAAPDRFYFGDDVLFDNTSASNLTANLVGDLTPNSVTVDASVNYTFTGSGKITGATGLTKTNTGTLTIPTANDFTGPTVLNGGTLSVSRLANSGAASSIGAASSDSSNLVLDGAALSYTGGSVSSDRGATFNSGGATFDVPSSGTTLTWNGTNIGAGSLAKSGGGTLTLTAENSFGGGITLSNGTLALFGPSGGASITANNYALGSGNVTLYSGILKLFGGGLGDAPAGYGNFSRPINIPVGSTATILTPARYSMGSTLTGGGTLNLEVNYVRGSLDGNWSGFTGTINITARTAASEFRVSNSSGYAGATLFVNDGAIITQSGSGSTMEIGAIGGTSGAQVGPGNSTSSGRSFRIGWNNRDATFAGQIVADGANTVTKVGAGTWTLTGVNTYTGGTTVDGGTLVVNNASGSGTGTGAVTVNTGAALAGSGIISGAVTINSGASIAPGTSIGTLTVNNSVTLAAGSTTFIEINKTSLTKDLLNASGTMTYGGTLIVTNLSGTLTNGDSFKIFNGGSYSGSFTSSNLPPLASDLKWNLATLKTTGTISVVSTNFTGPQVLTWDGDGVSNIWDAGITANWLTTNSVSRAFLNGDTAVFDDTGSSTPAVTLIGALAPAAVTVNASQNYSLSGTGALTGTMSLNKSGSGTFTIANTGANSFTGGTTISGGALQLGDGSSITANVTGNITNNASLIFANPTALTSGSVIRGTGAVAKNSAGALTFSSAQLYTGPTTINVGSVTFNGAPPSSSVITNNGVVYFAPTSFTTYGNPIRGNGSMSVSSSGVMMLSAASSFSGGLTNNSGFLILSNNLAAGTGPVVFNGGYVVAAAGTVITNEFAIAGTLSSDLCMMTTNAGTAVWAGNINVGGGQWRPGSDGGTLVFSGTAALGSRFMIVPRGTVQFASNAIVTTTQTGCAVGRDTSGGNRSATVTFKDNASVTLGGCSLGGNQAGGNVTVTIQDNALFSLGSSSLDIQNVARATAQTFLRLNGGTLLVGGFIKTKASQTNVIQFNGGVLKAGANNASFLPSFNFSTNLVQAGGAKIDDGGFAVSINGPLLHDSTLGTTLDGGLVKSGSGTLTISYINTYTGPTIINAGILALGVAPAAPTFASTNIFINAGAIFDPTFSGPFTLGSRKMVWGNGSVKGAFTIGTGAVLACGSNSFGTLAFSNSLTLSAGSTNIFEISHSPFTNDSVKISGALTNGGTLVVTNIGGALGAGDSFKLLDATSYSGAFANLILPALNSGLAWNTNLLNTSGIISVISTTTNPPVFGNVALSGSNFIFSGTGGTANSPFYLLGSTNLNLPFSNWSRLLTNQFDGSGNFNLTNPLDPAAFQNFYLLQVP